MNSLLLKHNFLLFGANSFSAIASMELNNQSRKYSFIFNPVCFCVLKIFLKNFKNFIFSLF